MANTASPHLAKTYETWKLLKRLREAGGFKLDGNSLHMAHVVGVALHGCQPQITTRPDVMQSLQGSAQVLTQHLANGHYVYGVNTGFGGSADSRTSEVIKLQAALMQLTQAGILSQSTGGSAPEQAMPAAWVRATIAVRCNSTLRGHSAVSLPVLQALVHLLEHGITPIVPLRGSVSASGDLMPLSYIAGAIEGNPDILVEDGKGRVVPAPEALGAAGLRPVALGPKEGLGLVNGTASSAAVGALVISQAHKLAVLTQALTAMAAVAERLLGDAVDDGEALRRALEARVSSAWDATGRLADDALPLMVAGVGATPAAAALGEWARQSSDAVEAVWRAAFAASCAAPHTAGLLYRFVRDELGVPFHRGLVEHPSAAAAAELDGRPKRTVGSWVSRVHDAIRGDSLLYSRLMSFVATGVAGVNGHAHR